MSEHVAEANRPSAGPRASGTRFPVFGRNRHGIIETWNEAMADLTKIPTEIVIHSSLPSLRSALPSFQFQADPELQGEPADVTIIDTAGRQHTLKCEFDVRRDQQSRLIGVLVTGIDPQFQRGLWEPSFTTKPAVQRAGLGLTIVDMLVNSVGGQLKITSTPGADANFSMILPNEQASISQRAPHPRANHQPRPRQV